jgi:hypothetical protein
LLKDRQQQTLELSLKALHTSIVYASSKEVSRAPPRLAALRIRRIGIVTPTELVAREPGEHRHRLSAATGRNLRPAAYT